MGIQTFFNPFVAENTICSLPADVRCVTTEPQQTSAGRLHHLLIHKI